MTVPQILPIEWGALFLLAVSCGFLALLAANPFFAFPVLLAWGLLAAALSVGGVIEALRKPLPASQRMRAALATPAVIAIVLLSFHLTRA